MRWGEPFWLWFLASAPLAAGLMLAAWWRAGRRMARLGDGALTRRLVSEQRWEITAARNALAVLAMIFAVLALARPQWGLAYEEVRVRGMDLVLAVDVSNSMLAEDVRPSRIARARLELKELVRALQGNRIGLVAFAGGAWTLCPLTLDYGAVEMFLDMLHPPMYHPQGTNIGAALEKALEALGERPDTSKVILLISDGEDTAGGAAAAVQKARERGVVIHTVGIGSPEGTLIPEETVAGQAVAGRGYKRDESGREVRTRLDETFLTSAAAETGGLYLAASTRLDIGPLTRAISSMSAQELDSRLQRQYTERYQWFLGAALLMLLAERALSFFRPRPAEALEQV